MKQRKKTRINKQVSHNDKHLNSEEKKKTIKLIKLNNL